VKVKAFTRDQCLVLANVEKDVGSTAVPELDANLV
jgi:hypothetical protein